MQQHMFVVCLIISLFTVFLNSDLHAEKLKYDKFNLRELFQRRQSAGFTPDLRQFQHEILNAHNTDRSRHCVPHLNLDDQLNHSAQKYAEHLASTNQFKHSDTTGVGENLYKMSSSMEIKNFDGKIATRYWYDEINKYDFNKPGYSKDTGHFTQVIWKDSKKLGVGYATSKQGLWYTIIIVAHYSPAGNVNHLFSQNVLPPKC